MSTTSQAHNIWLKNLFLYYRYNAERSTHSCKALNFYASYHKRYITEAHKCKTQKQVKTRSTNLFHDRQIFFAIDKSFSPMHKSFSQSTNLFRDAQNFFAIDKSFSRCTKLFRNRQIFFAMHKTFSRCTNLFRHRQIFFAMHKSFSQSTNFFRKAQNFFAIDKYFS